LQIKNLIEYREAKMGTKEKQTLLYTVIQTNDGMIEQLVSFRKYEEAEIYANGLAKETNPASEDFNDLASVSRGVNVLDIASNTLFEYFEVADRNGEGN